LSIKSKVLALAAALTLVGSAGLAGALTSPGSAQAATPSCGTSCIDIFSKDFGTFHDPLFVLDVFKQKNAVGTKIILFRESDSDPAEDFTVSDQGTVSDFYAAGLVSAALDLHYGSGIGLPGVPVTGNGFPDEFAFEDQYAPFGVDSGLCVGVASAAVSGEGLTLQPCGVSSKTVWVVDTLDSCPTTNPLYSEEAPVIDGSDTNFSEPFVATYPADGYPTDSDRPQLTVTNLSGFSQTGNNLACGHGSISGPNSNQLWAAYGTGVLP
jgi:hypothetical protein